jgi:hypothetical protein
MNNKHSNNEKELAFLKELGIVNPSPDQLKKALKDLTSSKVISKFSIKSEKE